MISRKKSSRCKWIYASKCKWSSHNMFL